MESKVKGFFLVTVLVAVALFLWSGMAGGLGDGALAGNAVSMGGSCSPDVAKNFYSADTITDTNTGANYTDECRTATKITEYFCRSGSILSQRTDCSKKGMVCESGACVDDSLVYTADLRQNGTTYLFEVDLDKEVVTFTSWILGVEVQRSLTDIGDENYTADHRASGYTHSIVADINDLKLHIETSAGVFVERSLTEE
ncbi:hypothetical protein HOA92_02060 [archaeon]|jgi:hypothetical protein|nr:hypothetical protein [archaeon]MBT6761798.1 hypothetical protein [archaeon]